MHWHTHLNSSVDIYCERTSAAFWSEPANALSNLAFVIAGIAVWRLLRADRSIPVSITFMAPLMTFIGVGSFAFHTVATRWSQVLDIMPIALFVLCYLASFLRWFYQLDWKWCLVGVVAFIAFTAAFIGLVDRYVPNHSGMYVPVQLLLVGLTVAVRISWEENLAGYWPTFGVASLVFTAALVARTVDENVCGSFSLGTHFIWHSLNGVLLYLVARPLIRRWQAGASAPAEPAALSDPAVKADGQVPGARSLTWIRR